MGQDPGSSLPERCPPGRRIRLRRGWCPQLTRRAGEAADAFEAEAKAEGGVEVEGAVAAQGEVEASDEVEGKVEVEGAVEVEGEVADAVEGGGEGAVEVEVEGKVAGEVPAEREQSQITGTGDGGGVPPAVWSGVAVTASAFRYG